MVREKRTRTCAGLTESAQRSEKGRRIASMAQPCRNRGTNPVPSTMQPSPRLRLAGQLGLGLRYDNQGQCTHWRTSGNKTMSARPFRAKVVMA